MKATHYGFEDGSCQFVKLCVFSLPWLMNTNYVNRKSNTQKDLAHMRVVTSLGLEESAISTRHLIKCVVDAEEDHCVLGTVHYLS